MQGAGVEVWTARPERLGCDACTQFMKVLDEEERARAARLRCEEDRRAFVVAHAMRRIALGLALALEPHALRFGKGPHGEPLLLDAPAAVPRFSLSRSRGLVAFALAAGPVGVDVEAIRDGVDGSLLAPYMEVPPAAIGSDADFYVQWTALEAYWKSRGLGLSAAQPRIRLSPIADDCWDVLLHDDALRAGMVVMRLPCDPTHVLALACEAPVAVRLVELDSLARAPRAEAREPFTNCKDSHCDAAAAPNMFNT
jgi:4'-phosphopantetheinyl transferase